MKTKSEVLYSQVFKLLMQYFQGDAFALKIVHRCFFPFNWRTQPDQFQYPVRPEDFDDDLSRNGATGLHGVTLDHCQLDSAAM